MELDVDQAPRPRRLLHEQLELVEDDHGDREDEEHAAPAAGGIAAG
ncbi:MAG: hypothetical protein R2695_14080 [Acidimicrobiales bacterium]